jgi:hypothetical protein
VAALVIVAFCCSAAHAAPPSAQRTSFSSDLDLPGADPGATVETTAVPTQAGTPVLANATPAADTPSRLVIIKSHVRTTLAAALSALRVSASLATDLRRVFGYKVPVGEEHSHIELEVACEQSDAATPDGSCTHMRSAVIRIDEHESRVYRYALGSGDEALVNEDGEGVRLTPLSDPLPNARMTSGFGWRIHPVLLRRRFHHGVDFAAPLGTPVLAAEDGTIENIGWRGHYGEYIRMRHAEPLETGYAHLSGYASGLRPGSQVTKGQVIGYVGETGWSTGPHLFFEVYVDGQRMNPLTNPMPLPVQLSGQQLDTFERFRSDEDRAIAAAANSQCTGSADAAAGTCLGGGAS